MWLTSKPIFGVFLPPVPAPVMDGPIVRLPDGRTLVFALLEPSLGDGPNGVGVVDLTTGEVVAIGTTQAVPEQVAALPDGTVLVLGQGVLPGPPWGTAELFDPSSGASTLLGQGFGANVPPFPLPDGRVLMFESGAASARILDPRDGSTAPAPEPPFSGTVETAVPLAGESVLLIQDFNEGMATPGTPVRQRAAIVDLATLVYEDLGPLPFAGIGYTATALADGTVLIAGGAAAEPDASDATPTSTAWILDPADGSVTATGSMLQPRWRHRAALLADGRVLLIGGSHQAVRGPMQSEMEIEPVRSTEIYDPVTRTFSSGPDMAEARVAPVVARLDDGSILVIGGWGGPSTFAPIQSAERFR